MPLNNSDFPLYEFDDRESIIQRIASELKTVPKYLYFPDEQEEISLEEDLPLLDIEVVDYLKKIKTTSKFKTLYETIPPSLKNKLDVQKDIIEPFIVFNKDLLNTPRDFQLSLLNILQSDINDVVLPDDGQQIDISDMWRNRTVIEKRIKDKIISTKKQADQRISNFKTIRDIREEDIPPSTDLLIEKIKYSVILDMDNVGLLEIFNHLLLDTNVPFVSVNNIYKILNDFTPSPDWSFSSDEAIILKTITTKGTVVDLEAYSDIILSIDEETNKPEINFDYEISSKQLDKNQIIDSITRLFQDELADPPIESVLETKVTGIFYYPNLVIDKYLMADLILNNSLFSNLLYIDESNQASKEKDALFLHFYDKELGRITFTAISKIMVKAEQHLIPATNLKFPIGEPYLRLKIIGTQDIVSAEKFKYVLNRLLVVYLKEVTPLTDIYRLYIPSFGKVGGPKAPKVIKKPRKKDMLKHIAPDIFLPQYSRICLQPPRIIDDDDAKEMEGAGYKVMRFPRTAEESEQRNYVCKGANPKYPDHIYPGLRENQLPNSDKFPYVPCCYKKDQSEREGSKYRHYYFGDKMEVKEFVQQELLSTNKFMAPDAFGTLPSELTKFFDAIDVDRQYKFLRKGTYRGKSSFLDCVLEGIYTRSGILEYDTAEKRETRLREIRGGELPGFAPACKQEMYSSTVPEIAGRIRDASVYLAPSEYIHLLELYYDCNIFVFTYANGGEMVLPNHIQAYYKRKQPKVSVFIYEHMGSESDYAEYPQCELIVRWKTDTVKDSAYSFPYKSDISQKIWYTYGKLRQSYVLNRLIPFSKFSFGGAKPVSQMFDSYGKTRKIQLTHQGVLFTVYTDPLQPLQIPEEEENSLIHMVDIQTIQGLIRDLSIDIISQSLDTENSLVQINGVLGNVNVYIPVKEGTPSLEGVLESEEPLMYSSSETSSMSVYNYNKKIARYLTEYLTWLFSGYVETTKKALVRDTILSFIRKYTVLDAGFQYGEVSKTFSTETGGLMKDGKLVVTSLEMLKRLLYVLKFRIERDREGLLNYYTLQKIPSYFMDITDFKKYNSQILVQGVETIEQWVGQKQVQYQLQNRIQVGETTPYFFQNNQIGKSIYLAQNNLAFDNAVYTGEIWGEEKYNTGQTVESPETNLESILYSYRNVSTVQPYRVRGDPNTYGIQTVGYKYNNTPQFTSLLKL